ncbi:MAG: hypothetical protein Q8S71_03855 [Hydrogenophaga sp.]|nr:hypothetical protein [Hydrogenophaga sp.]
MNDASTGFMVIVIGFLVILAILWFLLPFAIFGTKDLIQQQIDLAKETNALLKKLNGMQDNAPQAQPCSHSDVSDIATGG